MQPVVRPANPDDATQIAEVFRTSFDPDVLDLTHYSCRGAARYVREHLQHASPWNEVVFTVAGAEDALIGACELRRNTTGLLLNYIAIRSEQRSQGTARGLLLESLIRFSTGRPDETFELDVWSHNHAALGWYRRLGLQSVSSYALYEVVPRGSNTPAPSDRATPSVSVQGVAQSEVLHAAFGFSELHVRTANGEYSVGRLGDRWYRLLQRQAAEDTALVGFLRSLEPASGVFLMARPPIRETAWRLLVRGERMAAPLKSVIARLARPKGL